MTWPTLTLGQLTSRTRPICYGVLKPGPYVHDGVPLLRIVDLAGDVVAPSGYHRISSALDSEFHRSRLRGGEVLLSIQGTVGRVAIAPAALAGANISRTIAVIEPESRLERRFLRLYLMSRTAGPGFQTSGTTRASLNISVIREMPVPVPTLDEQRRIVDLLEDHLSRIDAAESLVATCLRRLLALRRSALAELHDGKPTPLGDLAVDCGYGTSEKCVPDGLGPAVVRIPNLIDGRIDLSDEKRIVSAGTDVARHQLRAGDLLIVRTNGSVDLIGRSAVVQDGVDAAFASYLIRYQLDHDRVAPEWVHAMLSTPQVRARVEALAASSAGQHNLSLGKLNPLELPIPTREVQLDGLARLAEIDTQIKRLRSALDATHSRAAHLRRSLLAAAFSGRLTASAPDLSKVEETISA